MGTAVFRLILSTAFAVGASDATLVVIGVGDYLGTGAKKVAVPERDFVTKDGRLTVDRSRQQLQAAQNVRLEPGARAEARWRVRQTDSAAAPCL